MPPRYVACIASYKDDAGELVRMSVVVTKMVKASPIVESFEWWIKDYYIDDMYDDVDSAVSEYKKKYSNLCVLHVDGLSKLTRKDGGYQSRMVTLNDLMRIMNDEPEKF